MWANPGFVCWRRLALHSWGLVGKRWNVTEEYLSNWTFKKNWEKQHVFWFHLGSGHASFVEFPVVTRGGKRKPATQMSHRSSLQNCPLHRRPEGPLWSCELPPCLFTQMYPKCHLGMKRNAVSCPFSSCFLLPLPSLPHSHSLSGCGVTRKKNSAIEFKIQGDQLRPVR